MEPEDLKRLIVSADRVIGYSPLGDEPDPGQFLREQNIIARGMSVLPARDIPPEEVARTFIERFPGERICLFVPGRAFDRAGTRQGRGGGWYDRFLALVPRSWVRIGVSSEDRISAIPLERRAWDEPVDYVLVKGDRWAIMATNAR